MDYGEFLNSKSQFGSDCGFEPYDLPKMLFPFQRDLVQWALRKGRAAMFADCGLGKTFCQLSWADNVAKHTGKPVLIAAPLAVGPQTVREGEKLGVEVIHRREGMKPGDRIVVTNYERLHYFDADKFGGMVCDESSILKNYAGKRRDEITRYMQGIQYRLLCTATAAPNDYVELGTSSEALGVMERKHMLSHYFTHDGGDTAKWRLKGHVRTQMFWEWMATWARAVCKPSDIGYDDNGFVLPPLTVNEHVVAERSIPDGLLFQMAAIGLNDQRRQLRDTIPERCERVAELLNAHDEPAVAWCHLNDEASTLAKLIDGAVNVQGSDSEERKEKTFEDFAAGNIRVMVSKPSLAGFGLNWQHCNHMTYFIDHSFEKYYQAIRRCWRFGQQRPVTVDVITTEGLSGVLTNLRRKERQAEEMFANITAAMNATVRKREFASYENQEEVPSWLANGS